MPPPSVVLRRAFLAVLATVALSGCDTLKAIIGIEEEIPLPGERISVLELEQSLEPDPGLADLAVRLPPPRRNQNWPQPGGYPGHAMQHLQVDGDLQRVWQINVGPGSSDKRRLLVSPVVAEGKIFAMDALARIGAYDSASGKRLWRYSLRPKGEESDNALGGGVAYEDGVIYVATGFGEVYALNAETGGAYWHKRIGIPFRAAPTVSEGRVFVLSYDNQLHVLSTANGALLWNHAGIVEDAGLLGGASVAVEGNIVIAPYSSGELFALRVESGRVAWADTLSRTAQFTPMASLSDINGRPVIDRGQVYAASHSGRLAAIELRTGERLWERNIVVVESPWVAGEFVFLVTASGDVVCLSRVDGRIRWAQTLQRFEDEEDKEDPIYWAGPILVSDRLIVVSSHGVAQSLSPYDGTVLGRIELGEGAFLSPIVADGTMFVLTDDGDLTAYR